MLNSGKSGSSEEQMRIINDLNVAVHGELARPDYDRCPLQAPFAERNRSLTHLDRPMTMDIFTMPDIIPWP